MLHKIGFIFTVVFSPTKIAYKFCFSVVCKMTEVMLRLDREIVHCLLCIYNSFIEREEENKK